MIQEQDLLTGNVPKKLIQFAFPLFLANLLQALYNVVDMLVVGKIVGEIGLAAISNASMLCFIINSLCIGLTMGGSVLVAQYKGAGDQKGQRDTIGMLFLLSLAASVVVTMLGLAVYEPLFRALDVPAEAYPDACGYMEIICWGTVFVFSYNTVCSILKGLGDSKTPLFFVGAATILNVLLDVLLVGPCSMGTAGAAWATITAQGISFAGSLVYLRRRQWSFSHRKMELRREILLAILKVGLPTATQMVVVNTAYLLVTGMLNPFGTAVAAASGVGLKINTFAGMHCWAIGSRSDPAGPPGGAVRPAAEPRRYSSGSGDGPVSGGTSHPAVLQHQSGGDPGGRAVSAPLLWGQQPGLCRHVHAGFLCHRRGCGPCVHGQCPAGRGGGASAGGVAAGLFPLHGLFRDLSGPSPFAHSARSGWAHLLQKQSLGMEEAGA